MIAACAKNELSDPASKATDSLDKQLSSIETKEDVFHFLETHHPAYDVTQLETVKEMLQDVAKSDFQRSGNTVELGAGSADGLQGAIDEAGAGGTVLIKAGEHMENGLVTIGHEIHLRGEEGAVMTFSNKLAPVTDPALDGGIHFLDASQSSVQNIDFRGGIGGSGVLMFVEESHRMNIRDNVISNFQFAVLIQNSNRLRISKNTITGQSDWLADPNSTSLGITVINGRACSLVGNTINNNVFGIWMCDKGGLSWGNSTFGNFYGQILCKVPFGDFMDFQGQEIGAEQSASNWLVAMNADYDNFYAGIVVIDGANKNTLLANKGGGNASYNVELAGDSQRFGFFTPQSFKNWVYSFKDQVIKDCGEGNRVSGGVKVDVGVDICD